MTVLANTTKLLLLYGLPTTTLNVTFVLSLSIFNLFLRSVGGPVA